MPYLVDCCGHWHKIIAGISTFHLQNHCVAVAFRILTTTREILLNVLYYVLAKCVQVSCGGRSKANTDCFYLAYIDSNLVGSGKVSKACIIGLQGGVWAKSAGYEV